MRRSEKEERDEQEEEMILEISQQQYTIFLGVTITAVNQELVVWSVEN